MLEVLSQDYIRTARAKGLGRGAILFIHALKNASLPVVTVIGIGVGLLIGGAVVTESVFAIPGLGRLTVDAILRRDYPVIQGVVLLAQVPEEQGQSFAAAASLPELLAPRKHRAKALEFVRQHPTILVGAVLLAYVLACGILAPYLWTVDPSSLSPVRRMRPPSAEHWFGTDMLGRDVYSRVMARASHS